MEATENEQASIPPPVLILDAEAQSYLQEAGKWAKFLAIMGFIFCGFILILAIFIGTVFSVISKFSPNPAVSALPAGVGAFMSFFYILIDVLYIFFPYYLLQFANKIKRGIMFSDSASVTAAVGKLKSFFKLWGIVTIVAVSFYLLFFLIILVIGVGAASMTH